MRCAADARGQAKRVGRQANRKTIKIQTMFPVEKKGKRSSRKVRGCRGSDIGQMVEKEAVTSHELKKKNKNL